MAKTTIAARRGKSKEDRPRAQMTDQEAALVEQLVREHGYRRAAKMFARHAARL